MSFNYTLQRVELFREMAALLRHACADRFFARIDPVPGPPRRRASRRHGWAIATSLAAVIVGFGAGVSWNGRTPSELAELIEDIVEYHEFFSHETQHLVEVPADQMEELTAWLGERVGRDIKVPNPTVAGLHFAGGRMLVVSDRPVAALMYTRDEGLPIALHVSRIQGGDKGISFEQRGAQRVAFWITDGYAYLVVGQIDGPTAEDLAALVAANTAL
jgi:anti-sigma factor RsiW